MGMPVTVHVVDKSVGQNVIDDVLDYFRQVDAKYSTYKKDSEISKINAGLPREKWSLEMKAVMKMCEETKKATNGFFDVHHDGKLDPSGLVKGWSILNASEILKAASYKNFYIEAGGDIQVSGKNPDGLQWKVGIRNPFNRRENVKTLFLNNEGVATSGSYIRGDHIYNPHNPNNKVTNTASITIIGPNVYEADRFATAAYAMDESGINFIESLKDFEGYSIDANGIATSTSGLDKYLKQK
jgi:thiamine biosynthesis lipoprotein